MRIIRMIMRASGEHYKDLEKEYLCLEPAERACQSGQSAALDSIRLRWRRERDSNPREAFASAAFRERCLQPLGHLSLHASQCLLRQGPSSARLLHTGAPTRYRKRRRFSTQSFGERKEPSIRTEGSSPFT